MMNIDANKTINDMVFTRPSSLQINCLEWFINQKESMPKNHQPTVNPLQRNAQHGAKVKTPRSSR
ncbi:hypothetical protein, partial [Serratia marcescens]|uniref:hypothetical protein n=1 Tax=Serratia marcescens TaxID=615 RepID=UPI00344ED151